jgi:hypothetical protein
MQKPPRIIDLGANQAFTTVLATVGCRRFGIRESLIKHDGVTANTPQGLQLQVADNSLFPASTAFGPLEVMPAPSTTNEPGTFPTYWYPNETDQSFHGHEGLMVARGPDTIVGVGVVPAQPLAKVASFTNTATSIVVIEEF